MASYVAKQEVRGINRKLIAHDFIYDGNREGTIDILISNIIQKYNPEDFLSAVPYILELKPDIINNETFDKILLLDIKSVYIQINSVIFRDTDKIEVIKHLKERGYKIVVEINKDDTVFTLTRILADIIKFDIHNIPIEKANIFECKKLAFNVNTAEDFILAEAANIDYYEGTYISPSMHMELRKNEYSKVNFIEVIMLINNDANKGELIKVIQRDCLMTAQLIRLSNSMTYRCTVESLEDAIETIGINNLKRWIFLLRFSSSETVSEDLLMTSYHRALFCERLVKKSKIKYISEKEAYLLGLFSTLDVLTGRSMTNEINNIGLSNVVEDGLIYRDGYGGVLINLVKAYEEVNWEKVDRYIKPFKLNKHDIFDLYFKTLDEVTNLWKDLMETGGIK